MVSFPICQQANLGAPDHKTDWCAVDHQGSPQLCLRNARRELAGPGMSRTTDERMIGYPQSTNQWNIYIMCFFARRGAGHNEADVAGANTMKCERCISKGSSHRQAGGARIFREPEHTFIVTRHRVRLSSWHFPSRPSKSEASRIRGKYREHQMKSLLLQIRLAGHRAC